LLPMVGRTQDSCTRPLIDHTKSGDGNARVTMHFMPFDSQVVQPAQQSPPVKQIKQVNRNTAFAHILCIDPWRQSAYCSHKCRYLYLNLSCRHCCPYHSSCSSLRGGLAGLTRCECCMLVVDLASRCSSDCLAARRRLVQRSLLLHSR